MQHYTVTELAFGESWKKGKQRACFLADVKDKTPLRSILVWSHDAQRVVSLPRSEITIHLPEARRWTPITAPRWLLTKERLWNPTPLDDDICEERKLAEGIVGLKNQGVVLPGQRLQPGGGDADGGRSRRR